MAKEKGYYEAAGLDVEILPFDFGIDVPALIEEGGADFGIGRESLITEYSKGRQIVALYALFQSSPLVLLAKDSSSIKSIDNFKNKRIMITSGDSEEASVRAILNSHHLKPSDYEILEHTHDIDSLINGETDVVSAYLSKTPFDLLNLNIPFRIFYPRDYGFELYSDFLFTSQSYIDSNLESAQAFKEASLKGWEYAYKNIQESAMLIRDKYNDQNLSLEALVYEGEILKSLSYQDVDTLGKINKGKLQRIYDLYNVMGFLPKQRSIDDFVLHNFGILSKKEKAYLQQKATLKVCVDPNWAPHEYFKDGKLEGISAAYFERFESLFGIKFSYSPTTSWNESLNKALKHECDILTIAIKTPQRAKSLTFSTPYFRTPFVVAARSETPFITDLESVAQKPIGYVAGYAIPEVLQKHYSNLNLIPVESVSDGLEKVADGKIFGFIDTLAAINHILQKKYPAELKIAGRVKGGYVLSFATRNDEPLLASIMEKALSSVDKQTKQTLNNQWSNVQIQTNFDYFLMWKILGIVFLLGIPGFLHHRIIKKHNKEAQDYLNIIDEYVIMSRTDVEGVITHASQALCRLSGYTKDELLGKAQNIFRHPDVPAETFKEFWKTIQEGKHWHGELINLRKDKTPYWVDMVISPIFNKSGKIVGYNAFQYDITDKKKIEQLSQTDSLTQIANRLYLDKRQNEFYNLAKRGCGIFSILLLDLDYFKSINDTFGHTKGDEVLVEVAKILGKSLRQTDVLGRWGGEEFLIICPKTTKEEAVIVAEKICNNLQKINISEYEIHLTCSIGVAQFEPNDESGQILERADKALYRAKREGRNRVIVA